IYALGLSIISIVGGTKLQATISINLTIILVVAFFISAHRTLWPFILTHPSSTPMPGVLQWIETALLLFSGILLPLLSPRQYIPFDPKEPVSTPNFEQTSSILSLLTYHFLDSIIWKGYLNPKISYDELPPLSDYDDARNLLKRASLVSIIKSPPLWSSLFSMMSLTEYEYIEMAVLLVLGAAFMVLNPLAIQQLLSSLERHDKDLGVKTWVWIVLLFVAPTCSSIVLERNLFVGTTTLVQMESILTQLMYKHTLRIRAQADASPSSEPSAAGSSKGRPDGSPHGQNIQGRINNLVMTDMVTIAPGRVMTILLWTPSLVVLSVWFLYGALGWSAFVGIAVMITLILVPGNVAKVLQSTERELMKKTDARIQTITETLNILRMIKLFGWESKINERISDKRTDELRLIRRGQLLALVSRSLNYIIPPLTMIATYSIYVSLPPTRLCNNSIMFSFPFDILREQLNQIFWMGPKLIAGKVSLDRLNNFLHDTSLLGRSTNVGATNAMRAPKDDVIGFNAVTVCWGDSQNIDHPVTPRNGDFALRIEQELMFKKGVINLITGPTGSGKTSLLMAFLGEMRCIPMTPASWFNLPRDGGVGYAAQEPWIQNMTITDNILFGSPYDDARYRQVIQQCALEQDLRLFEAGDMTEVGEKGLTLSGGQKARLSLARAIYSNAEILLLDDIFAALDVHTSRWIVDKCLRGSMVRGRTVLLVTHNVDIAKPIADFVVTLGANGTTSSYDTVPEASKYQHDHLEGTIHAESSTHTFPDNNEHTKVQTEQTILNPISDGTLIKEEEVGVGHVSWSALRLYFASLGEQWNVIFWPIFFIVVLVKHLAATAETWSLGYWSRQYETQPASEVNIIRYLSLYIILVAAALVSFIGANLLFILGSLHGSKSIHRRLLNSILGATYQWLDVTPVSRVITRCTQDIRAIDRPIPEMFLQLTEMTFSLMTKLGTVVFLTPVFIYPGILVFILGGLCGKLYIGSQLAIKRQQNVTKAPILAHFSETLSGLASVRAYGAESAFIKELQRRSDRYTRASRTFYNLNRWISFHMQTLGALFLTGIAAYLVYVPRHGDKQASYTGFSLNMAAGFSSLILWWVKALNEFEIQGNSVERIAQYVAIKQEPQPTEGGTPPAYWPSSGDLRVDKVTARYSVDGPAVLKEISFHIKSGERIGIVGRTGSGKSSLTLSLLRCIVTEGDIYYDGLSTSSVNLDALRSNITIIPQVPELLRGTLRENLDPFGEHSDARLNSALRASGFCSLHAHERERHFGLDTHISGAGANLSIGQRQILALARAFLRGSKLFILDEATSAIDYETDNVIQKSLRTELPKDVTVIIVAHRLQTVMDADRIMVLDAGRVAEFDAPSTLLRTKGSKFRAMVDGSGESAELHAIAESKH
ncbi:P-loop containing nucleoside triphosphate hydrolase protein, partial [Stereum hirsutum FP-91666 SS1]|uniref:P-loop containing nucleoside triphosphate hydrolase protein n=1 Tax=Stereum hirsutum (strain FP-91666) TaxID=721885 RepID=UPI000440C3BB